MWQFYLAEIFQVVLANLFGWSCREKALLRKNQCVYDKEGLREVRLGNETL